MRGAKGLKRAKEDENSYNKRAVAHTKVMIKLEETISALKEEFGDAADLIVMRLRAMGADCAFVWPDGIIDKEVFELNIVRPLKSCRKEVKIEDISTVLEQKTRPTTPIEEIGEEEIAGTVAGGDIVLIVDGAPSAYVFSERKYSVRAIAEPPVSNVLRGPREGFVEDMKTNMTMIRRRLRTPKLRLKVKTVGRLSGTSVCLVHIDGVADPKVVAEVERKVDSIDIDGVVEAAYIARYLEDDNRSLFEQVGSTEKPDIATAKLLEGRVAVIVDGSPVVLTVPFVMFEHLQSAEDYYIKSYRATLLRCVRIMALAIAIFLPAAYVALQEFQYQMFPLKFLITIMNSVYGIPLTPTLEMLVVLTVFEILSEASVRMPRYIGTALSIVGALILGNIAVSAGLLSMPTVLIISVSTIGMYCVPDEANTASVLRLTFVAVAGVMGLLGVILGAVALIAYLVDLRNFGTSYLSPFAPALPGDWKDAFFKGSVTEQTTRPYSVPNVNHRRMR